MPSPSPPPPPPRPRRRRLEVCPLMPPFAFHCRRVPTRDEVVSCLSSHSKKSRCKSNCRGRKTKIFLRGFELQRPRPPSRPPPCPPKVPSLLPHFFSHFHPAPSQEESRHCLSSRLLEIFSKMARGGPRCAHLGNCNRGARESEIGWGWGSGEGFESPPSTLKISFH